MKRGDLITVALNGDCGKPRPALILQSDLFVSHPSITILPLTTHLEDAPIFRIRLVPDKLNNLNLISDIMVDKCQSIARHKIGSVFGKVTDSTLVTVNRELTVFLGIA